jgi:hypothetical protein
MEGGKRMRPRIDYTAPKVIGIVDFYADNNVLDPQLYRRQKAALVKGDNAFWTDDKIKRVGLWQPGKRHAMDALRHLLYYKAFTLKDTNLLFQLRDAPKG